MRGRLLTIALLCLCGPAGIPGESDTGFGVGVITGFDTNPLLVSDDGPDGWFTRLRLDGSVVTAASPRFGLFASGSAWARLHDSDTGNADDASADLRAGITLSPTRFRHRLLVSAGGRYALYRGTFTDRATGEAYEAHVVPATDPPTTTPIPDRLDSDTRGAFFNARWKQNDRLSIFLHSRLQTTNYVEDYGRSTGLDPLDHESLTVEPGVRIRATPTVSVNLSVALTDLDYDNRPALDAAGEEVPDTTRAYRYAEYRLSLGVKPADRWTLHAGFVGSGRDDTYAGYYDNAARTAFAGLTREMGAAGRVHLYGSMRDLEYDNLTISGLPDDEISASEVRRFLGRFERDFTDQLRWFVESGTQRTDSRDPVFAYDRDWFHTGIYFRR